MSDKKIDLPVSDGANYRLSKGQLDQLIRHANGIQSGARGLALTLKQLRYDQSRLDNPQR